MTGGLLDIQVSTLHHQSNRSLQGKKCCLKKNLNARPSEHPPSQQGEKMSKCLGGIIGCKDKTLSWHLLFIQPDMLRFSKAICAKLETPREY